MLEFSKQKLVCKHDEFDYTQFHENLEGLYPDTQKDFSWNVFLLFQKNIRGLVSY